VDVINKIKDGMKQEQRATAEAITCATCIANAEGDPITEVVDVDMDDGFDTFEKCMFWSSL